MMEALRSSETSLPTRVTRPNIPEDTILHSHRSENPKILQNNFDVTYFFLKNLTQSPELEPAPGNTQAHEFKHLVIVLKSLVSSGTASVV
jgi:hypothetical protein